jgi:hypothetical protein
MLLAVALCAALSAPASRATPSKGSSSGGLVLPPIQRLAAEASVAADGKAVQCVDIRTGTSFEYRAQHLLPSGAIDQNWISDSTECCLGSPEGIREHVIPDGAGGSYAAWVDSRLEEPDIYLQRFTACGEAISGWPLGGRAVCAARQSQYNLDACPDGAGGVLLVWQDFRDERSSTIYLQRITESGDPAPGWPEGGMAPAPGGREQAVPRVAPDGTGGALVFWQERDGGGLGLRVQRVTGEGAIAPAWPRPGALLVPGSQHVSGVSVRDDASGRVTVLWQCAAGSSGATLQLAGLDIGPVPGSDWAAIATTLAVGASLISDGTLLRSSDGGLLLGWSEMIAGLTAVKLARLAQGGALAAGWPTTGATVVASDASLSAPALLADGAGGALVAWEDHRGGSRGDIYAQHVLGDGALDSLWAGGVPVATGGPGKFAPMLASDWSGGAIVTWSDEGSQAVAGYFSARRALAEGMPQLLRAETNAGYARLVWTLGAAGGATILGYRAATDGSWEVLSSLSLDDSLHLVLEDRAAPQGREVEYRLSVATGGAAYFLAPVRVTIPRAPVQLVLERAWTAPGRDAIQIAFALPAGPPARVEVFDVLGRQVAEASLGQFTPGYYTHRVAFRGRAVSGIYFVRLSQGGRSSSRRLSFLR